MAKNAFFKNPKISPFRGPYERVFGPDGRKIGRLSGFWPKTYLWTEFHRNRGRWPYWALYKNVPISHGRPLKLPFIYSLKTDWLACDTLDCSVPVLADDLAVPLAAKVAPDPPHPLEGVRHHATFQLVHLRNLGTFEVRRPRQLGPVRHVDATGF